MATFNGTEGSEIDLAQASTWTSNYRSRAEASPEEAIVKAHFYGREVFQRLLDQQGCMGIRIYYALDDNGQKQLVLVGADADGNDMEGMVFDHSSACPPNCSATGSLNR